MSESVDWSDAIKQSLGSLCEIPEGIDAFREALFAKHHSAARIKADVAVKHLPFQVSPIEWYSLGYRTHEFHPTPSSEARTTANELSKRRPSRTLDYATGDFFLQDAGSLLALAACEADLPSRPDRLICDLCAAPGGKASGLLESIGGGFLLANEPIRSRIAPLAYNLARTGSDRYSISSLDPDRLANKLEGVFDLVLVDAPCSGQALLGKGKQTLAALSTKQVEHSALRARRILQSALRLLRPGGQLVFSTCTFAEAENEMQVRWLLEQEDIHADPAKRLKNYASDETLCSYRLWPHRHQCAGSFAASVRSEIPNTSDQRTDKRRNRERPPKELEQWFDRVPDRIRTGGAVIWGWPEDAPRWAESIAIAGPEVAYRTGQTWKPSHQAALRQSKHRLARTMVELDDQQAKQFIAGQTVSSDTSGWSVATHRNRPLGWIKSSRGIGKNHLPAAARMEL